VEPHRHNLDGRVMSVVDATAWQRLLRTGGPEVVLPGGGDTFAQEERSWRRPGSWSLQGTGSGSIEVCRWEPEPSNDRVGVSAPAAERDPADGAPFAAGDARSL